MKNIKCKTLIDGVVKGEAIVSQTPFGFFGGVDPRTGVVIDKWHELHGENIKGKIFVYPEGRGSTVGAAIMLELARTGCAPLAIVNKTCETITVAGGVLAKEFYDTDIVMVDSLTDDDYSKIKTGDIIEINTETGEITIC